MSLFLTYLTVSTKGSVASAIARVYDVLGCATLSSSFSSYGKRTSKLYLNRCPQWFSVHKSFTLKRPMPIFPTIFNSASLFSSFLVAKQTPVTSGALRMSSLATGPARGCLLPPTTYDPCYMQLGTFAPLSR